jgi:hypothetical protein
MDIIVGIFVFLALFTTVAVIVEYFNDDSSND